MVSTRNALHLGPDPLGAGAGSSNLESSQAEEPNSSTNERDFISQEDYQAALLIVTFRDSGTSSTQTPEPLNAPPHARNSEPASPQPEPEPPVPGAGTSTNSNKQKKRRRKGFRLTHVKNERAKKAKARADAATRGINTSVPGPSRMSTRSCTRRQPTRTADETPRRLTRAAARAQAIDSDSAERDQQAESSKKGKGKEVVKGESDSDDVATSSKRRRCDSEDDELDELGSQGEPGPSTRRKRQKLDPKPKASDEPAEPPAPVTRRKSHSTATNIQRGVKRYRSLGPEPSEGRIEAERKRARREKTPERDRSEPLATSSRVQLGDTTNQAAVVVKVEEGEPRSQSRHGADTSRRHHPAANARLRHRPRVAPLERQETTLLDGNILRPENPLYYLP